MKAKESDLKMNLRTELRARVRSISPETRDERSAQACALLRKQSVWQMAQTILCYAPMPDEINILAIISEALASGKTVLMPRFHAEAGIYMICDITDLQRDLVAAKFGILEPHPDRMPFTAKQLDFALVPGVGFDDVGGRLGRGRGFYDRLLAEVAGLKCGVAYDEQIVPHIPTAPHDVKMNFVLTPSRWFSTGLNKVE